MNRRDYILYLERFKHLSTRLNRNLANNLLVQVTEDQMYEVLEMGRIVIEADVRGRWRRKHYEIVATKVSRLPFRDE